MKSRSTCSSIFIWFCNQQLLLAKLIHVIYFRQSQLLLAKTNEDRTASRKARYNLFNPGPILYIEDSTCNFFLQILYIEYDLHTLMHFTDIVTERPYNLGGGGKIPLRL